MQLEIVRSYPIPNYPTAVEFHKTEKLTGYVPRRWRGKRRVGQVLLFCVMTGLCSCSLQDLPEEHPAEETAEGKKPWYLQLFGEKDPPEPEPETEQPWTVPLFLHGEGRGSFGCDSVLPPVYLSEDEAAQVIRETALAYGVDFSADKTIQNAKLPYTNVYEMETEKTYSGELVLDGYDERLGIGYEYVSQKDVSMWHEDTGVISTVETFDMKGTAEKLTEVLTDTAVFYDPGMHYEDMPEWRSGEDWDKAVEEYCAAQKERMKADLQAQVKDFLEWLAAQGVI